MTVLLMLLFLLCFFIISADCLFPKMLVSERTTKVPKKTEGTRESKGDATTDVTFLVLILEGKGKKRKEKGEKTQDLGKK